MPTALPTHSLRHIIQRLEKAGASEGGVITLGAPALDAALPWGGLQTGALHDIIAQNETAAKGFAFALACRVGQQAGGWHGGRMGAILYVRQTRPQAPQPYGPGLLHLGLTPEQLLLAEATDSQALLWALEEGLRSRALAAVIGELPKTDLTSARRLQLAAEAGGTLGLLLHKPDMPFRSAARTRWRVGAACGGFSATPRWHLTLEHCKAAALGPREWIVEWHSTDLRFVIPTTSAHSPSPHRPPLDRRSKCRVIQGQAAMLHR